MRIATSIAAFLFAACAGAGAGAQAPAQPQGRVLELPAGSAWQHAQTQMILPSRVDGLARTGIRDLGESEMDVVAEYRDAEGGYATIFLFRTGLPDTALWFDRAAAMIALHPAYGLSGAPLPDAVAFTRPGAAAASGLRTTTGLTAAGRLRSTGVAIAPLGDHLLKIRISSERLDRAGLDSLLTRFIEGLRWPAPAAGERAAAAILNCPAPLRLRNARLLRPDVGEILMDALIGGIRIEPDEEPDPVLYCREPGATLQYGVYRPDASRTAYIVALNDAGIALSLARALGLGELTGEGRGRTRVSMVLLDRDSTSVFSSFNRLPPPAQAVSVAMSGRGPGISVTTVPGRD